MIKYLTTDFVPKKLQFCYFVNNNGELWYTPNYKEKAHWDSKQNAMLAWYFHTTTMTKYGEVKVTPEERGYKLVCIDYYPNENSTNSM